MSALSIGWLLHGRRGLPNRGTVIQFHGCCHNMTFDAHQVMWLTEYGFNVFMFDYRGYGESEGRPDRWGVHSDSLAALRHVRTIPGLDRDRLLVIGQSLGGCIGLAALLEDHRKGIRGVALDGTFGSYRALVNTKMSNTSLTYPLASLIVSDELAPITSIQTLSPLPILFFHSKKDRVIPFKLGQALFEKAGEPKKIQILNDAGHMQTFTMYADQTRAALVDFFDSCLDPA